MRYPDIMRLLDLFSGAGGAATGYHRAGFEVVGVDHKPQPRYPFEFHQGDALEYLAAHGGEFDVIHASPPCQAYTAMRVMANAGNHPRLIETTRIKLTETRLPFIIENVEQSPLEIGPPSLFSNQSGIILCGSMFSLQTDKYQLRRHRLFESNIHLGQLPHRHVSSLTVVGFYGDHARTRTRINGHHSRGTDITRKDEKLALVRDLMQIDWMTWGEAKEAIPPVYTEFIGKQLLSALTA